MILIDGVYYDPSYGQTYTSAFDFQNSALDGLYRVTNQTVSEAAIGEDLNGNGNQTDTLNVTVIQFQRFAPPPTGLVITERFESL